MSTNDETPCKPLPPVPEQPASETEIVFLYREDFGEGNAISFVDRWATFSNVSGCREWARKRSAEIAGEGGAVVGWAHEARCIGIIDFRGQVVPVARPEPAASEPPRGHADVSNEDLIVWFQRDPDCPYCVRLHPDERCTCTPSVNGPVVPVLPKTSAKTAQCSSPSGHDGPCESSAPVAEGAAFAIGAGFTVSEWEVMTLEPERLNVGKLNSAVRYLRELVYQQKLRTQERDAEIATLKAALEDKDEHLDRDIRELGASISEQSDIIRAVSQIVEHIGGSSTLWQTVANLRAANAECVGSPHSSNPSKTGHAAQIAYGHEMMRRVMWATDAPNIYDAIKAIAMLKAAKERAVGERNTCSANYRNLYFTKVVRPVDDAIAARDLTLRAIENVAEELRARGMNAFLSTQANGEAMREFADRIIALITDVAKS